MPGQGIEPHFQWVLTLPPASPNSPGLFSVAARSSPSTLSLADFVTPHYRRVSDRAKFLFFGYSPGRQTPQNARNCTQKKGSTHWTVTAALLMSSPIPYHTIRNFVNTLTQLLSHDASKRRVSRLPLRNPTTLVSNRKRSSVRYGKPLGAWRSK